MMQANTISDFSSFWSFSGVPVLNDGSVSVSMNGIRNSSLSRIDCTSWYALKISASFRPRDSTMYW
ncbi:hypothetical protein D3C87_2074620 [compost metagenome]